MYKATYKSTYIQSRGHIWEDYSLHNAKSTKTRSDFLSQTSHKVALKIEVAFVDTISNPTHCQYLLSPWRIPVHRSTPKMSEQKEQTLLDGGYAPQ